MTEPSLTEYAAHLMMSAQRVAVIADEVAEHVHNGNLDAAVLVLGVSHGKLGELNETMMGLQRRLQDAGADYKRALGQS